MGQPQPARVALITGASDGIGRACADRLAGAGWTVTGASRRGTAGPDWTGLVMNVDDEPAVKAGVAGVIGAHGRLETNSPVRTFVTGATRTALAIAWPIAAPVVNAKDAAGVPLAAAEVYP